MDNQTQIKKLKESAKAVKDEKIKAAIEKKVKQINKPVEK